MTFQFRPAVREAVGLIIGLAGGTGSGKTYSALRLASGISAGRRFAVIDTEAGRAKHYAADFAFDHGDLKPSFRPAAYMEAIEAADSAGYPVIVVDSVSHEWAGEGGILEWQTEEYERLGAREQIKLLSWSAPKQAHKRMVSRLLQCRAHLILCFRAEPHVEMVKEGGKTVVRPKEGFTGYNGWFPVTEKNLPFELTVSFMMMAEHPGVPHPIKLQEQHRALFPLDKPITEESGRLIAEWAAGGSTNGAPASPAVATATDGAAASGAAPAFISADQAIYLSDLCRDNGIAVDALCKAARVPAVAHILAEHYERSKQWIDAVIGKRKAHA